MAAKLWIAFALLINLVSWLAQASLDKYIDAPATGKDEVRQQCFVHYVLQDAINRYLDERVVQELVRDLKEVNIYLSKHLKEASSDASSCYALAYPCSRLGSQIFYARREITSRNSYDKACYRLYRFARLCELIRARSPKDEQLVAVGEWVCQVSAKSQLQLESDPDVIRMGVGAICKQGMWKSGKRRADEELNEVVAYTEEDLANAKEALAREEAADVEAREALKAEIAKEANQMIKARVKNYFNEFNDCWATAEARETAGPKQVADAAGAGGNVRKGLFGKVFGNYFLPAFRDQQAVPKH